ncbi:MAG TPA: hypothetical protein VIL54_08445 [Natronosporangium sp.]|jgi:hypothetical protein
MRTEETLRAALADRERLAPDPDQVLAGALRLAARHRRRRAVGAVAAGALVLVTASSVPVLVDRVIGGPGPAADQPGVSAGSPMPTPLVPSPTPPVPAVPPADLVAQRPPYSFTVAAGTVDGVEFEPVTVTPEVQAFLVRARDLPVEVEPIVQLIVHQPGHAVVVAGEAPGWDVTLSPVPTEVGGAAAWYSTDGQSSVLRWEYGEDAWAVLGAAAPLSEADLQRLARAVRFTEPYPAKVPYRLGYLPPDLRTLAVSQNVARPGHRSSSWQFMSVDEERGMDITIEDVPMITDRGWNWRVTTIAGYPARYADLIDGRRCEVDLGGLTISIGCGGLTPEELDRLVAGIEPATWDDPTTWYGVDVALPEGHR